MKDWDVYAICPGCGHHFRAPFGEIFHVHFACCPTCGEPKNRATWRTQTMRWVSDSVLFKPSTWGTGHWEERP